MRRFVVITATLALCASVQAQDTLKLGWPERGSVDANWTDYLVYKGMAKVSGTVRRMWIVDEMDPENLEGSLIFTPDVRSRSKYKMLPEIVDLTPIKDASGKVGLPFSLPVDKTVCGYEMQATLLLGDLYKFNISHSSGPDFAEVLAALERAPTKEVFCTANDERIDLLKPIRKY